MRGHDAGAFRCGISRRRIVHTTRGYEAAHQLRLEMGRRVHEKEEERLCNVCVTGKIESESHFFLECYVLREGMFEKINQITGYNLLTMRDNKDWMMDVLLGHGLKRKEVREQIGKAVATFIAVAMRIRKQNLN